MKYFLTILLASLAFTVNAQSVPAPQTEGEDTLINPGFTDEEITGMPAPDDQMYTDEGVVYDEAGYEMSGSTMSRTSSESSSSASVSISAGATTRTRTVVTGGVTAAPRTVVVRHTVPVVRTVPMVSTCRTATIRQGGCYPRPQVVRRATICRPVQIRHGVCR